MKFLPTTRMAILLMIFLGACALDAEQHSLLWVDGGEAWAPQGRLPDFSFAGYQRGERPLPEVPAGISVKEFGATGDGTTDDTAAFLRALAQVKSGAIEVPPGRYVITDILVIDRSNIVLRGAGPDKTILYFPKPLNEIKPDWGQTTSGRRTSNYSWSGGFITLRGSFNPAKLSDVVAPAQRGDYEVVVGDASALQVGQEVEFSQSDTVDNSLAVHLYSGDPGPIDELHRRARVSLVTRIRSIQGKHVRFDRPLRCDVELKWHPQVGAFHPSVVESGVQDVAFEFPLTDYRGHFTELGFNPVALSQVAHCWIRNVRVLNADSGLFITGAFNTVDGFVLESARKVDAQGCCGHHGTILVGGDNLFTHFNIKSRFIHDVTVSAFCSGNVFSLGQGVDLSLDHHRRCPYENLFTHLDAGAGTRLWKCGGGDALGKNCGARGTFWNIRSAAPLSYPPDKFGPESMNLVGLQTTNATTTNFIGRWFEAIPPGQLEPQNLHQAQLQRRLGAPDHN